LKTKYMKKIFLYTASLLLVLVIGFSCKKSFLDRKPIGQEVIETYFTTEKRALEGIVGVYDPLGWDKTFDRMFWCLGDGATDDNNLGASRDDAVGAGTNYVQINIAAEYTNMRAIPLSPAFSIMYKGYYDGINRANLMIKILNDPQTTISDVAKKRFVAEAKTLRAIYYFMLVNYYGGVPLFTDALNPQDATTIKLPRSSAAQVYAQIEKDLNEAIVDLPKKSVTITEGMVGRMTKGTAYGMLVKAYLYQKKFTESVTAANSLTALGEYNFNADYFANFRATAPNGSESILEVQHNNNAITVNNVEGWGADGYDGSSASNTMNACFGGYGFNRPSGNLYNSFTATDTRRKYVAAVNGDVVDGITFTCGDPTNASIVKFTLLGLNNPLLVPGRADVAPINRVLIRYSDVLMMKAEALSAAAAPTATAPSEAVSILVQIRNRGGLTIPTAATYATYTADQLLSAIRQERRREFGMEGWRLFDLHRWGIDSTKNALIRIGKIDNAVPAKIWKDAYMLYPLPQSEIDISGGAVIQNPGY
jgi:starch-binding outer membrane protein, SusD/RagB family